MARWLPLLLSMGLPMGPVLAGCGGERVPAPVEITPSAASTAPPAAPAPATRTREIIPGPNVTLLPDGTAELRPPVGDVAMLRRMPDGTFRRACGAPEADMRDMIQAKLRARRGGR